MSTENIPRQNSSKVCEEQKELKQENHIFDMKYKANKRLTKLKCT